MGGGSNLARLLAGNVGDVEGALERAWHGPDGANLRYAYVLEQFARRVCDGDFQRASEIMEWRSPRLGYQSPREAARTDAGMLGIPGLISEMESRRKHRGVGAFIPVWEDRWLQECILVLDLLPIAWGLSDDEFEGLLGTPSSWLHRWRDGEIVVEEELKRRVSRLRSFHDALRTVVRPDEYPAAWRSVWPANSPIGQRSPLQAFEEEGDAALDRLENFFWIYASSNLDGS